VWTYVQNWMVQDGELPELSPAAVLPNVALRAACWTIRQCEQPEAVTPLDGPDPDGLDAAHHAVTGTVEHIGGQASLLLRVGTLHLLAAPVGFLADSGAFEYASGFWVPDVGTQATAICRLEVMAHYESEDAMYGFDGPNIRRDWVVHRVRVRHRALDPVPRQERTSKPGRILRVDDVDRMRRWDDDTGRDYVDYIVDLAPATP
jgi:hypothetical protein